MSETFVVPPQLVAVTDSSNNDAPVEPGDLTNRAVRVNIVAGSAAGVTHTDDSPFIPGSDDGVPIFGFFDDVASDSVDEGDAGAVRMSGNRNLYIRIRDNAGNERGANVTALGELNTLATAQPGVDIGDVTVNNAGGAAAVNVQDGGNSITVDGAVTISGTVDTELPAAVALADDTANPTVPGVGSFFMGFDGTNWDRVRADGGSVFIQDGGNSITVDSVNLDIRDLVFATDKVDISGSTISGIKSNNGGVPGATNLGTLPAVATAAAPSYTEGNQVALSLDLTGALRTAAGAGGGLTDAQLRAFAAILGVTATAAVGVAVTLTLPAAGVGLFHYISNLEITADTARVPGGINTSAIVTSTNLNGSPAWNVKVERNNGGVNTVRRNAVIPLRSNAANIATTIIAPATANVIWRLNVEYYTGP